MYVKATGPKASVIKYDILTALMTMGLHDKAVDGRLAQRLVLLITARFNWQTNTFKVGLREMARLWSVTERTCKRELTLMRARGWISIYRHAARGRVAEHQIHMDTILDATRPYWPFVGPDFVARMAQEKKPLRENVVPFSQTNISKPEEDGSLWSMACGFIFKDNPALYAAWISKLHEISQNGTSLELAAPNSFTARYIETNYSNLILAAVTAYDSNITSIKIIA